MNSKNIASILIICISIVIVLIYGQTLLIPFIFAMLLWFIIRRLRLFLDKIPFIRTYLPTWFKNLIISYILFNILNTTLTLFLKSITTLTMSYHNYKSNINLILNKIHVTFNIDLMTYGKDQLINFDFNSFLVLIFNTVTNLLSNSFLVILYAIFLFIEETYFQRKLHLIFNKDKQQSAVKETLTSIEKMLSQYLSLKTIVSLITGALSYTVLLIMGVDSPEFWAFLIIILNYIPTIGSLMGTAFPVFFSLLQFGEFTPSLLILLYLGTIQIVVGNILEPKLMGSSLNISSLVAILSLSFWGSIWGITGMILSIPITVTIIIIFSQFNKTKPVAIILSGKGDFL